MALMVEKVFYSSNPRALFVSVDAEKYSFPVRSLIIESGCNCQEEKFQSKFNEYCNYSIEDFINLTYSPSGFLYQPIILGETEQLKTLQHEIIELVRNIDKIEKDYREIYKGERR